MNTYNCLQAQRLLNTHIFPVLLKKLRSPSCMVYRQFPPVPPTRIEPRAGILKKSYWQWKQLHISRHCYWPLVDERVQKSEAFEAETKEGYPSFMIGASNTRIENKKKIFFMTNLKFNKFNNFAPRHFHTFAIAVSSLTCPGTSANRRSINCVVGGVCSSSSLGKGVTLFWCWRACLSWILMW